MTDKKQEQVAAELQALADRLFASEVKEWPVATIHQRFAQVTPQYRYDQTIRTVGGMIERIAKQQPQRFITSTELLRLYNSVAGLNPQSAFKRVFADLLPEEMRTVPDNDQQYLDERRHHMFDDVRDTEVLARSAQTFEVDELSDEAPKRNQLGEIYDPNDFIQDPSLVQEGQQLVSSELTRLGQHDIRTRLKYANQDMLVFDVAFRGPNGEGVFSVPIELHEGEITLPTDFGTTEKGYPLTEAGLHTFFADQRKTAEKQERSAAARIRDIYAGDVRDLDEVGAIEISEDQLVGEDELAIALPNELQDVEAVLTQAVLRKESRFEDSIINNAAKTLQNRLREFGFVNARATFVGDMRTSAMRFKAKVITAQGETEIGVPMEVSQEGLVYPVVFIGADNEVYDFSAQGFANYLANKEVVQPVKISGEAFDLTYNELQKAIYRAAIDGQRHVATEALNIISDKFGPEAYNNAIHDYQTQLAGLQEDHNNHCQGCAFFKSARQASAPYASDHCLLLNVACKQITKTASGRGPGHCVKSSVKFREEHDQSYSGLMNTSQISLT